MAQAPTSDLQPLSKDSDKGGHAPALKHCEHLKDSSFEIPSDLSVFRDFKDITCDADNCDEKECWLCCKCYKIFCGRYANKHMLHHYKQETNGEHCIAMSMGDSEFWCFKCFVLKIDLSTLPDDMVDEMVGSYLDDGAIPKVYEFYEQAHLAHWSKLPATSEQKNNNDDSSNNGMASIDEDTETEVISTQFDATTDGLDKVPDLGNESFIPDDDSLNRTGLFYDKAMTLHKCEDHDHVERPGRISVPYENLKKYGLLNKCKEYPCKELDIRTIKYTHPNDHIKKILRGYNPDKKNAKPKSDKSGNIDGDTFYNQHTPKAALMAAGGFYECLEKVCITEEIDNGFALVRPPGHHACESRAMGFCHFNNVVVGINGLKKNYGNDKNCPKKVLIVDWDVHHGNGTQDLTYGDSEILYFSVHRYADGMFGFYPGTGALKETGQSPKGKTKGKKSKDADDETKVDETASFDENSPLGKNVNVTMSGGMGDYEYLLVWRDVLIPIAKEFKPDLIVVSAGFDACTGDPLGGMRVTPPCYGELTKQLQEVQSKVVILLEGGYNLDSMPKAICCCVHSLLTINNGNNNSNSDSKQDDDDDDNDDNSGGKKKEVVHACLTPLLDVQSDSHWKKKMTAGFELTDLQKDGWNENELRLIETSFGYNDGCLQCVNKWSGVANSSIEFHNEWMKHVWRMSDMLGQRKGNQDYATQVPAGRHKIDGIIESVLGYHCKFWPCLKELEAKYQEDAKLANMMDNLALTGKD